MPISENLTLFKSPPFGKRAYAVGWAVALALGAALFGGGTLAGEPAPIDGLSAAEAVRFAEGRALFATSWLAPAWTDRPFDGLGPTFNARACLSCHPESGRGGAPAPGRPLTTVLLKLGIDRAAGQDLAPHPAYGRQLNPRAVPGVPPEGQAFVEYRATEATLADGTRLSLRQPAYAFFRLAFGPLGDATVLSPRIAPALAGLGLLEAVPEARIRARADPHDRNGDGISGRARLVEDPETGVRKLGRFGWKAAQPSLRAQAAAAFHQDMGVTTPLHPDENCPDPQIFCLSAEEDPHPDANADMLDAVTLYTQALPAPRADGLRNDDGARAFRDAGCAACHTPLLETGPHPLAALSGRRVAAYTDLLLHDMGPGLADRRGDGAVADREWRTPPLWGLQQGDAVPFLLHDGRARGFAEAILWHGGEGAAAREAFRAMPDATRMALLAFLRSL